MALKVTDELGNILGSNIKKSEDLNQSMSHSAGEDTNILFPTENLVIEELATRNTQFNIGNSFVLGHPVNGIIGATGKTLGAHDTSSEVLRVVSPNNTFKEFFATNNFINTTNTTATLNTSDEEVSFSNGEVLETEEVFMNDESIQAVSLNVTLRSGFVQLNVDTSAAPGQELDVYVGDE